MSDNGDPVLDSIGSALGAGFGIAGLVLAAWWTAVAFVGGTMPLLGTEAEGGVVDGLEHLLLVTPCTVSALYFLGFVASVVVLTPIEYLRRDRPSS